MKREKDTNHEDKKLNETPFATIPNAVKRTGLSAYYLRDGCKSGTVPHIKSGKRFFINVPELMRKLNEESKGGNV